MRRKGSYNGRHGVLPSSSFDLYEKRSKKGSDRRVLVVLGLVVLAMLFVGLRLFSGGRERRVPIKKHRRATTIDDDDHVATGISDDGRRKSLDEVHPFVASKRRPEAEHKPSRTARANKPAPKQKVAAEARKKTPPAKVLEKAELHAKKDATIREKKVDSSRVAGNPRGNSIFPEVSILEEHHHVLAYYLRSWRKGSPESGATVLHIDSHADLGVPSAPQNKELPREPGSSRALEQYSEINDFLVLGAYLGLMDHVVFVEPPWSNQFRCCVYENNATFHFVVGTDKLGALRVDVVDETARLFARERFSHVFWRNGERRTGDGAQLENVRPFKVSLVSLEHPNLGQTLKYVVGDDLSKPLVLDIDLDAFVTVSPGAIATKDRFRLTDTQLETLYHMVWNFPPLGVDYMLARNPGLRDATGSDVYVARAQQQIDENAVKRTSRGEEEVLTRLGQAIERILVAREVSSERRSTIVSYANLIDNSAPGTRTTQAPPRGSGKRPLPRPLDPRTQANLEAYLEQPFHIPEDVESELDFALEKLWAGALSQLQTPSMIHLVRSPGYVSHLSF